MRPGLLLQVHEHALLQLVLAVADGNAVVVSVQAVDQRLRACDLLNLAEILLLRLQHSWQKERASQQAVE